RLEQTERACADDAARTVAATAPPGVRIQLAPLEAPTVTAPPAPPTPAGPRSRREAWLARGAALLLAAATPAILARSRPHPPGPPAGCLAAALHPLAARADRRRLGERHARELGERHARELGERLSSALATAGAPARGADPQRASESAQSAGLRRERRPGAA